MSTKYSMSPCFESISHIQLMWWVVESLLLMQIGPSRTDLCVFWIAEIRFATQDCEASDRVV